MGKNNGTYRILNTEATSNFRTQFAVNKASDLYDFRNENVILMVLQAKFGSHKK